VADRVWIPGGDFDMGSERHYREEGPVRRVSVDGFFMDRNPVTNTQFARFVTATGYVTVAEVAPDPADFPGAPAENLVPGSMVFTPTESPVDLRDPSQWWRWVPGADWRHPSGPGSDLDELGDHPVVHLALADVEAYCTWVGAQLPSEAEWEFAARGGLEGAEFVWGDLDPQDSEPLANTWQGRFPWENTALDGWERTSPVGSFPANGLGLHDMAGNVWEWTADWYTATRAAPESPCCVPANPRGATIDESYDPLQPQFRIPRRVVKGGSHLCAPSYCYRYRPAARQPQMIDTGMSHVGFRTITREPPTQ
jgi:formylglycine-generating enzyme required for sulfatase activity